MKSYRFLSVQSKSENFLVLSKSRSLQIHEGILFVFWLLVTAFSFWDESKMVIIDFYAKHLPAGLLVLPTSTKLIILVPFIMTLLSFLLWSFHTSWQFDRTRQTVVRIRYLFFLFRTLQKKWSYAELHMLKLTKPSKGPSRLFLRTRDGKEYLLERTSNQKKIRSLSEEIRKVLPLAEG